MTVWIVTGITALCFFLIGMMPVALDLAWETGRFAVTARIGGIPIPIGSGKDRKNPAKEKARAGKQKKRPSFSVIKILAKNGYNILGRVISRGKTDTLKIHFTSSWPDPAVTAMAYAAAGAAMDGILHIGAGRIAHPDLRASADFEGETPRLDFRLRQTIRVHQLLGAAACFGFGFLRDFILDKRKGK